MMKKYFDIILLLPFVAPEYFETIPTLDFFLNSIKVVVSLFLVLKFNYFRKYAYFLVLLFVFLLSTLASSIINKGSISNVVVNGLTLFFSCLSFLYVLRNGRRGIVVIYNIFVLLVIINFFSLVFFPNGLYTQILSSGHIIKKWFLGFTDSYVLYYFPTIFFGGILYFRKGQKSKYRYWLSIFICILSSFLTNSTTSLVCLLFVFFYNIFPKIYIPRSFVLTYILINIIVVIFRVHEYFSIFIENILGKSKNLTGRDEIWNLSLLKIARSPIWGYGFTIKPKFALSTYMEIQHCHSYLLNITYESGVMGLLLFLIFLATIEFSFRKKSYFSETDCFILVCITSFLISSVFDAFQKPIGLFISLTFIYWYSYILPKIYSLNSHKTLF